MQLGVATSSYSHRAVARVLCNALIAVGIGLQSPFNP
jgi:hypothetical protein